MMYEACCVEGERAVAVETAVFVDKSVQVLLNLLGIPCGRFWKGTRFCAIGSRWFVSSLHSFADGILSASCVLFLVFHKVCVW